MSSRILPLACLGLACGAQDALLLDQSHSTTPPGEVAGHAQGSAGGTGGTPGHGGAGTAGLAGAAGVAGSPGAPVPCAKLTLSGSPTQVVTISTSTLTTPRMVTGEAGTVVLTFAGRGGGGAGTDVPDLYYLLLKSQMPWPTSAFTQAVEIKGTKAKNYRLGATVGFAGEPAWFTVLVEPYAAATGALTRVRFDSTEDLSANQVKSSLITTDFGRALFVTPAIVSDFNDFTLFAFDEVVPHDHELRLFLKVPGGGGDDLQRIACAGERLVADAIYLQDHFLIASSSYTPAFTCPPLAKGLGAATRMIVTTRDNKNLSGASAKQFKVAQDTDLGASVRFVRLVPRSDGAWLAHAEGGSYSGPVRAERLDAQGNALGTSLGLTDGESSPGEPAVAALGDECLAAAWLEAGKVKVRLSSVEGSSPTVTLPTEGQPTEVALWADGATVLVSWVEQQGGYSRLFLARYQPGADDGS